MAKKTESEENSTTPVLKPTVPVLTIDGPSGSGKGTIAQRVAAQLGWHFLDSGAIYRVMAYRALQSHMALNDEAALVQAAGTMELIFGTNGEIPVPVCLDGQWLAPADLRTESVAQAASQIAALGSVRQKLLDCQRHFCKAPGLVADGRDMGTVVFPDAGAKVYLTASVQARTDRRVKQLVEKNIPVDPAEIYSQIEARDERDMNRPVAPLKPADDALIIDNTDLSIDDVFQRVLSLIQEKFHVSPQKPQN